MNNYIAMFVGITPLSCHDLIVFAGLHVFYKKGNSEVSSDVNDIKNIPHFDTFESLV